MYNMKEGGLAAAARQVAEAGRGGDTMLAHVTPEEAGLLKALGGAGTINPETGLPEFLKFKLGRGGLDINIGKKSQQALAVAAGVGAGLGYIPSFIPGLSPVVSTGVLTGLAGALGNQSLNAGLNLGLSAYGAGSLTQAVAPQTMAGAPAAPGGGTGSLSGGPAGVEVGAPAEIGQMAETGGFGLQPPPTVSTAPGAGFSYPEGSFAYDAGGEFIPVGSEYVPSELVQQQAADIAAKGDYLNRMKAIPYAETMTPVSQRATTKAAEQSLLRETLPASVQKYIPDAVLDASGTTLAAGTFLGSGLIAGQQERAAAARQQAQLAAAEEEKRRRYRDLFASTLGSVPVPAKAGGLMKLAGGGMTYMEAGGTTGPTGTPRDVTGTGDGMSDSVPATIEGVQEARLADGEFVVPADVVADIGNGSSDAGSKKLYDMMDRIRKARHGTTKQPPEIDAEALMPA